MAVRFASPAKLLILHWLSTVALVMSLLTGLRLFISNAWHVALDAPWANWLPSGDVFALHVAFGWLWLVIVVVWAVRRYVSGAIRRERAKPPTSRLGRLNLYTLRAGRVIVPLLLITGVLLWSGVNVMRPWVIVLHAALAFAALLCVLVHIVGQLSATWWQGLKAVYCRLPSWRVLAATTLAVPLAITATAWMLRDTLNSASVTQLIVHEVPAGQRLTIDGVLDEPFWQHATPVTVITRVPGSSAHVPVEIRAARHGLVIYFAFSWEDPTQSLAHLPLIKTDDGWKMLHDGLAQNDERRWYEDKFAVIFSDQPDIAGNSSFHFGTGKPETGRSESRRGAHYVASGLVDMWHWKAVRNHGYGVLDDSHFGTPYPHVPGEQRYTAGYKADPSQTNPFSSNYLWFYEDIVVPKRLPNDPAQLAPFQTLHDDENAVPFALSWYETKPYSAEDDHYPVGTLMPSILWITNPDTDRADAAAQGRWHDGRWTLEVARGIAAESGFDLDITDGTYLWVATFDHTQVNHSYHLRPLRIRFE
ncbi:cytochrome b/b6 domain-containing protein [Alcanivorax sp. JB21]|uniref:ethylbenzene dehydrogenase-related protein n=1 Tax=Alcanivorax limicola TaxID=2874102 RepID=UPI001CBFF78D|nr:ethylbenzene dehydrogenase-related protein [Alcanivorax limicola]MBZ2189713.1 cytochrome b/b6 domain-containing protein [Alcanivorax limicola]